MIPTVDPDQYEAQLVAKQKRMETLFAAFDPPSMELYRSSALHYRMRAEFRVWHEGDSLDYVMFEPGNKHQRYILNDCPMVDIQIEGLMFELLDRIREQSVLRQRLFQIDFLTTQKGETLVSLLYHRQLDQNWINAAKTLREDFQIDLVGRARKQKIVLDRDFVIERLNIEGRDFYYQQRENSFTQPNAGVCEQMIEWAIDVTRSRGKDLVEFYCGNGNFTLPLAQNFDRVIATEISKDSVRSARYNLELNKISNVDLIRMSSEEFTEVLRGERTSRRLKDIDLSTYQFDTVFVDPPRSGLDDDTVKQVASYPAILYISCNPETLANNLKVLTHTHRIERFALFDQFPYTHHIECGVYLVAR